MQGGLWTSMHLFSNKSSSDNSNRVASIIIISIITSNSLPQVPCYLRQDTNRVQRRSRSHQLLPAPLDRSRKISLFFLQILLYRTYLPAISLSFSFSLELRFLYSTLHICTNRQLMYMYILSRVGWCLLSRVDPVNMLRFEMYIKLVLIRRSIIFAWTQRINGSASQKGRPPSHPCAFHCGCQGTREKEKGEKKTGIPSLMQLHKVRSRCCFFFYAYRFLFLGSWIK